MTWPDSTSSAPGWSSGSSQGSGAPGWGSPSEVPGWGSSPGAYRGAHPSGAAASGSPTSGSPATESPGGGYPPYGSESDGSRPTRPRIWLLVLAGAALLVGTVLVLFAAVPGAVAAYLLAVAAILLSFRFRADDNRRRAEEPRYSPSPRAERVATGTLIASLALIVPTVLVIATWVARL